MKKLSIFGLIHSNNNLDAINKFYKEFFIEVSKNFTNFYVIDLSNLIFFKKGKSRKAKINKFPKNFIFFKPKNLSELKKFLNKYNLIAVNNIGKNPDFFWVLFWLKKLNVKLINIIYSGVFGLSTTINIFEKRSYLPKNFYNKGFYYLYRILTIFKVLPKIEILFHSDQDVVKKLKNSVSKKFDTINPFFNISYYKQIIKINSRSVTIIKKKTNNKKYILFIDCPIMTGDRLLRDYRFSKEDVLNFYKKLNYFLFKLSRLFKLKVIIAPHPRYKNRYLDKSKFYISKKSTRELIYSSKIVVFSTTGAIVDAIFQKKKIINIRSQLQGEYQLQINQKYVDALKLLSFDLDNEINFNKKQILIEIKKSEKKYSLFINKKLRSDKNNDPNKKIIKIVKKNFFN